METVAAQLVPLSQVITAIFLILKVYAVCVAVLYPIVSLVLLVGRS
jgi:hypothetical protein